MTISITCADGTLVLLELELCQEWLIEAKGL